MYRSLPSLPSNEEPFSPYTTNGRLQALSRLGNKAQGYAVIQ